MSNSIERRTKRQREQWAEWETFDGVETSTERIVEEMFYESGAIKARRTIERSHTRDGRQERRTARQAETDSSWDSKPIKALGAASSRSRRPAELEDKSRLGDAMTSGARWLGRKLWDEVLAGRSK